MVENREPLADLPPILAIQREMRRGERPVWAERPVPGTARRMMFARLRLGLVFTGFALFWIAAAFAIVGAGDFGAFGELFPLFGVPFVVVGLVIMASAVNVWRRLHATVYGISTERVLLISDLPRYRMRAVDLVALTGSERVERKDGTGDLALVDGSGAYGGKREWLFGVPEIDRVSAEYEKLRREAAERANQPPENAKPAG
ncbi:MAG: hypothetical protein ABI399_11595 [Bauldia sp.]